MPLWLDAVINFLNSKENVRLTQEMVENTYKPEIVVRLLRERVRTVQTAPTESTDKRTMILSIKNVGPGVARKIKFEGDFSFRSYEGDLPLKKEYQFHREWN